MKTRFSRVVGLAAGLLVCVTATVQAQFQYTTGGGTVTITGYTGPGGDVVIPDTINGLPVTTIGDMAFFGCSSLTSITIPNSVTSIGWEAFSGCTGLTSITIPDSVTTIWEWAFSGCTSLTSVVIGNSVTTIWNYAFYNCTSLTSIVIPDSVTLLGDGAFYDCTSLTSITIPESVTSIGSGALRACTGLTEIKVDPANPAYSSLDGVLFNKSQTELRQCPGGKTGTYNIPISVTRIGDGAFSGCTSLTSITIPNSVTRIGDWTFFGCAGLTEIKVDPANPAYSSLDGVLLNKSQTELITFPGGKTGTYTIPNSVTSIGDGAFRGCTGLTSITIPDSVKSIRKYAFAGCGGLTSITIPESVISIGSFAFEGCTGLTSITIPDRVTSIEQSAFSGCTGLISVTIPDSVTSIGRGAFGGCSSLTSIVIPNSVTTIGDEAFGGCSSLTSITIPDSVTSIGEFAFYGCTSLTRVIVPERVTNLGAGMISGCTNLKGLYFLGDAPWVMPFGATPGLFLGPADQTVAYYLAETTGWYSTLGDLPTAIWKPQVLAGDGSFGIRDGHLSFDIFWARDKVVVVEACADLANPDWVQVETRTLTENVTPFSDPDAASHPGRFYRIREQ